MTRLEEEARYWNKKISEKYNIRAMVNPNKSVKLEEIISERKTLIAGIAKKRGEESAKKLEQEMEHLWPLS